MGRLGLRGSDAVALAGGAVWLLRSGSPAVRLVELDPGVSGNSFIACSADGALAAVLDQKVLSVYDLSGRTAPLRLELARAAGAARFAPDSDSLLVADKTGDGYRVDLSAADRSPVKIVGHLSMLLDVLMSDDGKHVITCDRDEKIKVSRYPDTYDVRAFCLGHAEFVTRVELLPHDRSLLLSASGDGTVRVWNFVDGEELLTVDVDRDLDPNFVEDFKRTMKTDDVDVETLPISCMSCCKVDDETSLVGISNYSTKHILLYTIKGNRPNVKYAFFSKLDLFSLPDCFVLNRQKLWILYCSETVTVEEWDVSDSNGKAISSHVLSHRESSESVESFLTLYKRKFDNVQEYQARKKLRLNNINCAKP